jgi:hypothetical protein
VLTFADAYRGGAAYEIEFVTLDGWTAAVVALEADRVRPVAEREMTHARRLATGS